MTDPEPSSALPRPDRRSRRPRSGRRVLVGSLVALAVVALVASAALARSSSGPTYRTAAVSRATVAEQIRSSGTIEPVAEATVSFPTSGTVASVAVNVGDTVRTGQVLATLDTTGLQATLDQRNATLAQARLTLANAEAGQSSSTASGGSGGSGSGGSASSDLSGSAASTRASTTTTTAARSGQGSGATGSGSAGAAALAAAQQAVIQDQQQLDRDLALARADLTAAQAACASNSTSNSTTTSTTAASAPGGSGPTAAACLNAQRQLLTDQTAVSNTETSLAGAEQALDTLLSSAASSSSSSSNASSTSTGTDTSSSAGTAGTASSSGASTTPSAQELVADQAAVDAAAAEVAVAQQGLDQASIVSPINGTVAAVELAVGDSVTADSSTQAVVVAGPGGYEVATTVSVSNRAKLQLGDAASVVTDGSTQVLAGRVVAIGVAGTTSGTSTTYPVVIGFPTSPTGLRNGASASVTIELASVVAATAVPTSAVHTAGTSHTVTVLDGATTRSVKVTTGVVGAQLTQIKTGLHVGQVVVLADLSQSLPSSDSTNTSRRSGLGGSGLTTGSGGFTGGFGGTGGPPAGGPGGG